MDDLAERFARAERQGLIEIVRAHAHTSLTDFLMLVDEGRTGRLLGTLTIAECREGQADPDAIKLENKAKLRAVYDARILAALGQADEPLSHLEVQAIVGGTADDALSALQRLTASNKVARIWKDRGHGYRLVG